MQKKKTKYTSLKLFSSEIIHHAGQSDFIYTVPSRDCNTIRLLRLFKIIFYNGFTDFLKTYLTQAISGVSLVSFGEKFLCINEIQLSIFVKSALKMHIKYEE